MFSLIFVHFQFSHHIRADDFDVTKTDLLVIVIQWVVRLYVEIIREL